MHYQFRMAHSTFQLKVMITFGIFYLENMTIMLFTQVFPVFSKRSLFLIVQKKNLTSLCFNTIGNGRPHQAVRSSVVGLLQWPKKILPAKKLLIGPKSWLASLNWKQQVTLNSDLIFITWCFRDWSVGSWFGMVSETYHQRTSV